MRRALAVVALLFAALAVADALEEAARPSVLSEAVSAIEDGRETSTGLLEAGEAPERRGAEERAAIPEGFEDEAISFAGASEIHVDEAAGVVGFVSPQSSEAAFSAIAEELENGGWAKVPSGWAACGSFAKSEGRYRWVFVACTEAGGATSVVVHYATSEEGR